MEYSELINFLRQCIEQQDLLSAVLSDPITNVNPWGSKVTVRPVTIKGVPQFQFTLFQGNQTFHRNLASDACIGAFNECLPLFNQAQIATTQANFHLTRNKGRSQVRRLPPSSTQPIKTHDRKKQHLLPEGIPDSYLIGLGLMTANGKVIAAKANKFRQINRFLELVDHTLDPPAGSVPSPGRFRLWQSLPYVCSLPLS